MPFAKISHTNCLFGTVKEYVSIMKYVCVVTYVTLKYTLKSAFNCIEIYVLCNSVAMRMDITETYNDMTGLPLLLRTCNAEKPHLGDRVEIRGL